MSSPRPVPPPCAGVLELQNRAVGPIRLPDRGAADFLKRFNEVYLEIGLQIAPNPALVMAPSTLAAAAVSVVASAQPLRRRRSLSCR